MNQPPKMSGHRQNNSVFVNAPDGTFQGVIVDIAEPEYAEGNGQYKGRWQTRLVVQLNSRITAEQLQYASLQQGKPLTQDDLKKINKRHIITEFFGWTMDVKSNLRKFAQNATGLTLFDQAGNPNPANMHLGIYDAAGEIGYPELEKLLLGRNVLLSVRTEAGEKGGKPRPRITSVMPVPEGSGILVAEEYTRIKDRDKNGTPVKGEAYPVPQYAGQPPNIVPPVNVPGYAPVSQISQSIDPQVAQLLAAQGQTVTYPSTPQTPQMIPPGYTAPAPPQNVSTPVPGSVVPFPQPPLPSPMPPNTAQQIAGEAAVEAQKQAQSMTV